MLSISFDSAALFGRALLQWGQARLAVSQRSLSHRHRSIILQTGIKPTVRQRPVCNERRCIKTKVITKAAHNRQIVQLD